MNFCCTCARTFDDAGEFCPYCGANLAAGRQPREPYHIKPGTMLNNGRYILGRAIGYGGFGVTYAAMDLKLERRVAIKDYLPSERATRSPGTVRVTVLDFTVLPWLSVTMQ